MTTIPQPDDERPRAARLSGLQAYTFVVARILEAAAEQLSERELRALHEIVIELVARHVEARRLREAA